VFYLSDGNERDIDELSIAEFDALAMSFVEEITNVRRDIWDVFARAKFVNWLLSEGELKMLREGEKIILVEAEEEIKNSSVSDGELASQAG